MKEYTLRELCEKCQVTRRAVQWYESHDLVKSCGKTKQCYLLYDENTVEKVKKIKSLQNYGFTISEIKLHFESNQNQQRKMLVTKAEELREKSILLSTYIKEIEMLLNKEY